mgnify:FL=1
MIGKIFIGYLGLIIANQSFGYISDDIIISKTCFVDDECWSGTKRYTLRENVIGKKVQNIDLKEHVQQKVIVHIIADVQKHKLLIFKNQCTLPAERQVAIGIWFNQTEAQTLKVHQHT